MLSDFKIHKIMLDSLEEKMTRDQPGNIKQTDMHKVQNNDLLNLCTIKKTKHQ